MPLRRGLAVYGEAEVASVQMVALVGVGLKAESEGGGAAASLSAWS